jgi:hypothetical protein
MERALTRPMLEGSCAHLPKNNSIWDWQFRARMMHGGRADCEHQWGGRWGGGTNSLLVGNFHLIYLFIYFFNSCNMLIALSPPTIAI